MMTQLRERTAIILWIVILAFVGLIVFQWGADYTRTASRKTGDNVGVINGQAISLRQFQEALRSAVRQQQRGGEKEDESRLVREIWDIIVRDVLLSQEIERLGIRVGDRELVHYTRFQPPEAVRNIEVFQTDGKFDPAKYSQFITNPMTYQDEVNKAFVQQIEQILKQQLLNFRLQQLIMETVQVSPAAVRQHYVEQREKVQVEYLFAPSSVVGDDEVNIAAADLEAYYQEHIDEYHHPEQIRIAHVFFPLVPTAEDSVRIGEEIERLRQDLEAGADFAELAEAMSEDPGSAAQGGDLGVFGRGQMVAPFEEAAFALKAGEVSAPVQTPFGWHLIKVEERLEEDGEEKVRARHILLKFQASRQTGDALRARVEEFQALAEERGFEVAAQIDSLSVRNSGYLQQGQFAPALGMGTTWLVNLFFESEVGAIRRGGNERGFWVAKLLERRLEGVASLDEVRASIEGAVTRQKKAAKAGEKLEQIRRQVPAGASLAQVGEEADLQLQTPEPFSRTDALPGIGRRNAFIGAAFRLEPGELSEVVTLPLRGSYLIRLLDKIPIDEEKFQEERDQVMQELLRQRRNEAVQTWFAQLYKSAEIEDNRHYFYAF